MKTLVTGGNGFIGSNLAKTLRGAGEDVFIVDRKSSKEALNIPTCISDAGDFFQNEITQGVQCFDTIYHLAAIPRIVIGLETPDEVIQNNTIPLMKILEYCRKFPSTKLIFVSSSTTVWADITNNPYALSKKIGEQMVEMYVKTFGVKAAIVRPFNVYGPGDSDYGDATTLIKQCEKSMSAGIPLIIYGEGSDVRDFTHVQDVVDGLILITNEIGSSQLIYELGANNSCVSVKEVVKYFVKDTIHKVAFKPGRPLDCAITTADNSKWPNGWNPTRTLFNYIDEWKSREFQTN